MFAFNLVFLAFLVIANAQSGIPQYIQGQWVIPAEDPQYDGADGNSLAVEEILWPESSSEAAGLVTMQDQNLFTTTDPHLVEEPESKEVEESAVWKIVLVAAVLLVSIVGSLSVAYYLCVWRGGRIHYQVQKEGCA